jgi:o-succinylbenzoate---CoA ligase
LISQNTIDRTALKIIICESNHVKFIDLFLTCLNNNNRIFLANPNWKKQEWQEVLNLVQPDLILGEIDKQADLIKFNDRLKQKSNNDLKQLENLSLPLIMIPTGGSSGKIRFTIHTWETLTRSAKGFQQYFGLTKINSFCILPLYHVSGLMLLLLMVN